MKNKSLFLKKFSKQCGIAAVALSCSMTALADWSTNGNKILDPNGNNFIYRGVNLGTLPTPDSLPFVIKDIAAAGANAVRIPVQVGTSPETIKRYIDLCKQHRLVCVLTNVSTYGYGDNVGSASWSDIWSSWINSFKDVLVGNEDYVAINVASAPTGNGVTNLYLGFTETAIFLLRYSGLKHQLIIDGGNWGQDWEFIMRDNAERIMATDPLRNTVFSVHMFEAYKEPTVIRNYLKSYLDRQFPIMISEFGPVRRDRTNELNSPYTTADVDEDAILQISQELGVGYLGWNWSGYSANYADLNIVTSFDPALVTPWGNKLLNSANGIKATAKLATHYSTSSSSSSVGSASSSSQAANRAPYAVISSRVIQERCGYVYAQVSGAESQDPDGDNLNYSWQVYDTVYRTYQNFTGKEIKFYMRPVTTYQFILDVDDGRGGKSTATKDLSHSYSDYCVSSSSSSSSRPRSSSSSSLPDKSSSSIYSSSSIRTSSSSSIRTSSSSSVAQTKAQCSYVVQSQWGNGFTAAIRIKNTTNTTINGWDVNWQYSDGSKVTNLWNATLSGSNPYNAKNLSWNAAIQPGQTVEFGFQGSKTAATAAVPAVTGAICQ